MVRYSSLYLKFTNNSLECFLQPLPGNSLGWPSYFETRGLVIDVHGDLFSGQVVLNAVLDLIRLPNLLQNHGKMLLQVVLCALK